MPFLNINSKAVVEFTNKLEKMRRSDLPIAIRGALNKAAFNTKQVSMPESAKRFKKRNKGDFFKANSKVEMAKGFDVPNMKAIVGFTPANAKYNNKAVEELQQQEYGGEIKNRELIPSNPSRTGNSVITPVRPMNRLKQFTGKKIIKASEMTGRSSKEKFIKAAIATSYSAQGGYVIGGINKLSLYRINSVKVVNGKAIVDKTRLYSFSEGRNIRIKETGFMRSASLKSANQIERFYIAEAQRRFLKALK